MNILKSLGVLIYIVLIVFASVRSVLKCKDAYESSEPYIGKTILTGFLCLLALTSLMKFPLLNPFDRNVKFEPYATLEIPPGNTLQTPHFWHAAYDGLFPGDESIFFNPEDKHSPLGFEWPSMDFANHTYIITYGQELEMLSYNPWESVLNVWDVVRYPFNTGGSIGQAELSESFDPNKVYVYEIPPIRIDNDP